MFFQESNSIQWILKNGWQASLGLGMQNPDLHKAQMQIRSFFLHDEKSWGEASRGRQKSNGANF